MNIFKNNFKNSFFYKTLFVVMTGFIIKVLGLLNKIIITRLLGTEGMTLYILAFPTILLLINISSFSLNITISKLIAENSKTNKYSEKKLLKKGISISLIISLITIIFLLLTIKLISYKLLNNRNLFFPILSSIFLIPLVGITDTLKGYYNGKKLVNIPATASFTEQVFRILFSIITIYIFLPKGIVIATSCSLIAMSIGELASIMYLLIKIRHIKPSNSLSTCNEAKEIFKIALPSTLTKLIGSITYFLEPILYTSTLLLIGFNQNIIETHYTIINAYAIPLLTSASFLSIGLSTTLIPNIAENYATNNISNINYYVHKAFEFALVPGILISILLYIYPNEYMDLIYNTSLGTNYIKSFVFIFTIYYLQAPCSAILQAIGKQKLILIISTIMNILRIILIVSLSYINIINLDSIFYSIIITSIISTIILLIIIINILKFKIDLKKLFNLTLISLFSLCLGSYLQAILPINFFLISIIISLVYFILSLYFKTFEIKSIKLFNKRKKASTTT